MYENVIVSDVDGVMLLWEHGFHMWMMENNFSPVHRSGFYEIHDMYGLDETEANLLMKSFNESAALKRLPPVKDAIKYIKKLHEEHGYIFHCISAIPNTRDMYDARLENLQNVFGKTVIDRLTLCGESKNKRALLKEYDNTDCVWIEDLTKNCEYGIEYGMRCILMDRHYNQSDNVDSRVKRVHNWKEIYSLIEGSASHEWYK
jgi:5'(3')-deoxyribonucleotidase